MKKTRLYNVIFPVWMLFLVPQVWLIALPGNLIIDCAVLLITLTALRHTAKLTVLKQVWWKIWLLGFGADFVGIAFMLPALFMGINLSGPQYDWWSAWVEPILYNCFRSPLAFLWTAAAVALSGVCIYFFDKWAMRSCDQLTDRQRHIICLTLAIATAPWTFFIPMY
ncbi:MAG: hypothetical protein J6A62_07395 [Oscillospiraceae bacterium]|nr:hypothetical protein [Oscillospiraceae bacterium]